MRKFFAIAAASLGLLLFLAVAAELIFGTWLSEDPLDQLGLARDSAVTVQPGTLYAGGADFVYRRDHWGFRGAGLDPAKIGILTVGGSTTNQLYLPDDATWQVVMERALGAEGRDAVVANAGVEGQSTIGHVRAMADWFPHVPALRPRFVMFYVGLNDIQLTGSWGDQLRQSSRAKWVRQHSALVRVWNNLAERKARLSPRPVDYAKAEWTERPLQPNWKPDKAALSDYKERLRQLAEMTHAMGAVPILVTQPRGDYRVSGGKVLGLVEDGVLNGVDHYRRLAAYNQATREVCEDQGLLCLDPAREISFEPGDFYDYVHNSPQGSQKLGRWFAAKLAGLV